VDVAEIDCGLDAVEIYRGDCIEVMKSMEDNSIDSIVTDPPYGLSFMEHEWDSLPPGVEWAEQCRRVLKPGGHLLSFGGTRTWHRLACAIEDAGFEIRDSIAWLHSQGWPKSLDVSKQLTKSTGEQDERWQGWGTSLKPAFEPIVVGRKPLTGTVVSNILEYKTGGLNIDACRVRGKNSSRGRHPTNVVLDAVQAELLDAETAHLKAGGSIEKDGKGAGVRQDNVAIYGRDASERGAWEPYGDSGGASRFYPVFHYSAKATKKERPAVDDTVHSTVKPLELMRWLVKLVTPDGGVVLDPFAGSGTTIEACILEGFRCIGIEREPNYLPLIQQRISRHLI